MLRPVELAPNWHGSAALPLIGFLGLDYSSPVSLLPNAGGHRIQIPGEARSRRLTGELRWQLNTRAFEVFPPLGPGESISLRHVMTLAFSGTGWLRWVITGLGLGIALLGMLIPLVTQQMIGTAIPLQERGLLSTLGLLLLIAALLAATLTWVQARTISRLTQELAWRMQPSFLARLLAMPVSFYRDFTSGDLTNRVLAVNALQSLFSAQVLTAAVTGLFSIAYIVMMLIIDPWLGIAGVLIIFLSIVVLLVGIWRGARHTAVALEEGRAANGWLVQCLRGIGKLRLAGAEDRLQSRYTAHLVRQADAVRRQTVVSGRMSAWFVLMASLSPAIFFIIVGLDWTSSPMTQARYLAFASAFGLSFTALVGISSLATILANARPNLDMLRPVFDARPTNRPHQAVPDAATGRIEFDDVTFRYTKDGPKTLKDIRFELHPGETLAIVGASGSGKSTIVRLILGFEQPTAGRILVDGVDVKELDMDLVRDTMGVVLQSGQLTRGTVIENILGFGADDVDRAWRAAAIAAIDDDIKAMPMEMETMVDPWNVSGGQAQRLLLARALAKQPKVVILDEATSSLDGLTQQRVIAGLSRLTASRLVIAHRIETIRHVDRIVVMKAGRIVQEGTYDQLLAVDGAFTSLLARQKSGPKPTS
jgi:ATP-binding cassette subfamily C protein